MFMSWKVPSRLTDNSRPVTAQDVNDAVQEESVNPDHIRLQSPKEARKAPLFPEVGNHTPRLMSRASGSRASRLSLRQSAEPRLESRFSFAKNPGVGARQCTAGSLRHSLPHTPLPKPHSSPTRRSPIYLGTTIEPTMMSKAQEMLKHASPKQKRVIEKVLQEADRTQFEKSLNKTLQPEAKESVINWLDTASEQDRIVAVQFFKSLSGSNLMSNGVGEQHNRINQVIDTLNCNKANGITLPSGYKPDSRDRELQFLRLLTPNTRKNRQMHTTWHHLPPYRDDNIVNNRSAVYMKKMAFIPRHFTIHPDWGP